jgi:hypothetical protein
MSLLWRKRRELHQDQIHAIDGIPPNGQYLLLGPPGSGKTSILLHRGQYLRLPPHNLTNTRLLTFSRTLREFIAVSGDDRFPPALIETFKAFVDQKFKAYGVRPPTFERDVPLSEQNRLRATELLQIVMSSGPIVHYDALLVDEIQDLSSEEIELVFRFSTRIMLVGDARQRIYASLGGIEAAIGHGCQEIILQHHFRISPQICRVADAILVQGAYQMAQFCHYQGPTPSEPVARGGLSRTEQLDALEDALDLQLDTYNDPGDLIGIIAWRQRDCDLILDFLDRIPRFSGRSRVFHSGVTDRHFDPRSRICIVTLQSCKGLEFRALHWLFVDEDGQYLTRQRAYTAVTRAKSSLTVYHNEGLPSFLAGAFPSPPRKLFDDDDE